MLAQVGLAAVGLGVHLDQVDHAHEVGLGADRQLKNYRNHVQTLADGVDSVREGGAGAVQLVHVADTWNVVAAGLTPNGHRLRLNAGDAVENGYCTVENTERTLHLDGEVDVSWGVNNVDLVVVPETGGSSGGNGNATLLLLLHPVHGCGAIVRLTDLVVNTGVVQDALCSGGLTGIDVRHNADIAHLFKVGLQIEGHVFP